MERYSALDMAKGASVVLVGVMTLFLLALLPQPGYRLSRLVLFGFVILVGWIGAAGVLFERFVPTVCGALGLFLIGFWQFTIGLVMLPTSGALFISALLLRENTGDRGETSTA